MKVYVFGTVASSSVTHFALKQIPNYFNKKFSRLTFGTILNNFCLDNLLNFIPTLSEAIPLRK